VHRRQGGAASDGGRFDVLDPATGAVLTTVANGTVEDAMAAVDAADAAAASGRRRHRASGRRSCARRSS